MLPIAHQLQDVPELHEVDSLFRLERMLVEKRNDSLVQVIQLPHAKRHSLCVIVAYHAAPKELLECIEQLDVSLVLNNCEFREDLIACSHLRMAVNADEETSFAVHKPDHPLRLQTIKMRLNVKSLRVLHLEPSLRIVPVSDQILTAAFCGNEYWLAVEEFPAYSSVLLRLAILTLGPL